MPFHPSKINVKTLYFHSKDMVQQWYAIKMSLFYMVDIFQPNPNLPIFTNTMFKPRYGLRFKKKNQQF
jgi:hypothetical protein